MENLFIFGKDFPMSPERLEERGSGLPIRAVAD